MRPKYHRIILGKPADPGGEVHNKKETAMPDIRQNLFIAKPIDTVFSAITTEQGLSGWWTPKVTASPTLGSVARFGFGPSYIKEMLIDEIEPPHSLRWRCVAGTEEWVGTVLTFQLFGGPRTTLMKSHPETQGQIEQAGAFKAGTILCFAHSDWRGLTPMFAECSYTWGRFLHSLKLLCETGRGHPSPHEHAVHESD
jgi:uncharacterized protein YndB with AHSA1/START domain